LSLVIFTLFASNTAVLSLADVERDEPRDYHEELLPQLEGRESLLEEDASARVDFGKEVADLTHKVSSSYH
jgi:hypothetical protein